MKKILIIAVPLILIAVTAMGVGSWQAMQKIHTLPAYSIKVIRESLENRNAEIFYKLVDIDKILALAADEIVTAKINDGVDAMTYSTLELAENYETLKQDFITASKIALDNYFATGQIKISDDATEMQKWLIKSGLSSCYIKNFSEPAVIDGAAHFKVYFHNDEMNFSFEVEITMDRISETEWRVIDAKGFDGYYLGVKRGLQMKLASLNAPIQSKIAETFDVKKFSTDITEGDEYGFSKNLKISLDADYFTDKPIEKIIGRVVIDGRDGNFSSTPFEIEMADTENGLQTFEINRVLNPFIKKDSDVMKHGLKKRELHIEITEIDYLDGTVLKEYDKLPE